MVSLQSPQVFVPEPSGPEKLDQHPRHLDQVPISQYQRRSCQDPFDPPSTHDPHNLTAYNIAHGGRNTIIGQWLMNEKLPPSTPKHQILYRPRQAGGKPRKATESHSHGKQREGEQPPGPGKPREATTTGRNGKKGGRQATGSHGKPQPRERRGHRKPREG